VRLFLLMVFLHSLMLIVEENTYYRPVTV